MLIYFKHNLKSRLENNYKNRFHLIFIIPVILLIIIIIIIIKKMTNNNNKTITSKVDGVAVSRHGGEVRYLPVRVQLVLVLVPCIRAIRALRLH